MNDSKFNDLFDLIEMLAVRRQTFFWPVLPKPDDKAEDK
jgi:hypothetical protein